LPPCQGQAVLLEGNRMLKLVDIKKDYTVGDTVVHALKGVNLEFREHEFVAILGHSGCGKTTLLNIIGGLDQYSSGDLIINGRSTKNYTDADWDSYRNHSIGFVFQSYNLIPHQTVLANVELALTLSGVAPARLRRWKRSASAISFRRSRTRCPVARCSALPLPVRSSMIRIFSWPTSLPARSTPIPPCR